MFIRNDTFIRLFTSTFYEQTTTGKFYDSISFRALGKGQSAAEMTFYESILLDFYAYSLVF